MIDDSIPAVSAIIPTHNPRREYLTRTLTALRAQTLPADKWELLVIDNASSPALTSDLIAWHPSGRVVREQNLGLTAARLRGLTEAKAEILVWADDDNVLAPDYLEIAVQAFAARSKLGAAGGKSLPVYDVLPPAWYQPDLAPIGCRDLGEKSQWAEWSSGGERTYPTAAPIGAGLVIRRQAMQGWADRVRRDPQRMALGRTGVSLSSGEDNDINLSLLADGWELGYLPNLSLQHLIPAIRLTEQYQRRIAHATFRDFARVLQLHGVCPWPPIPAWTLPLRKAKAWVSHRAWTGPAARIRWSGACGQFEGRVGLRSPNRT